MLAITGCDHLPSCYGQQLRHSRPAQPFRRPKQAKWVPRRGATRSQPRRRMDGNDRAARRLERQLDMILDRHLRQT